jgi:hypothetical protein
MMLRDRDGGPKKTKNPPGGVLSSKTGSDLFIVDNIDPNSGFTGVRQAVWQHTIGGYQVLHKWLDDRRKAKRSLSDDDIAHWRRVYAALDATQRLMQQIDEAIVAHGGWPAGDGGAGAFSLDQPPPDPVTLAADAATRPKGRRRAVLATQTGFGFDSGS